jgi:hypothetical protein
MVFVDKTTGVWDCFVARSARGGKAEKERTPKPMIKDEPKIAAGTVTTFATGARPTQLFVWIITMLLPDFQAISAYSSLFRDKIPAGGMRNWQRFAGCNPAGVGLDCFAASLNRYYYS